MATKIKKGESLEQLEANGFSPKDRPVKFYIINLSTYQALNKLIGSLISPMIGSGKPFPLIFDEKRAIFTRIRSIADKSLVEVFSYDHCINTLIESRLVGYDFYSELIAVADFTVIHEHEFFDNVLVELNKFTDEFIKLTGQDKANITQKVKSILWHQ